MSKTISDLREKWTREKESYVAQEVGSGVQGFVKSVLECPDVFSLREGALSTPIERRRNEFIYEKKTKERRCADFVIYVDSEIIIPVEVEPYTKIKQGEKQLAQYQSDLDKKYGLLTDGFSWRFYNNNIYRQFTIDEILSDTDYILEFWREYVKPENYYLSQFGQEIGQMPLLEKTELHIDDNSQLFFRDITTLIGGFKHKLKLEGYLDTTDKKEAEKIATEITYAYIIQYILYKTLVDNGFEGFGDDYKSRLESIRNAIKSRSYKEILGVIDGMSHQISESIYRPFVEEQETIRSKLVTLMHKAKSELSDVSPWLDIIVFVKKYDFRDMHNEIFGYVYENYLKELYEDEKKGQYFTDPAVVNFMLEQLRYTACDIRRKVQAGELDRLSIVDPACGSGTFLYSATNEILKSFSPLTRENSRLIKEIVSNNVFGLDVEEFPLYLAEMSILMRMLPLILGERYNDPIEKKIKVFLTKDSIAEFIGAGLEYTDSEVGPAAGQLSYFGTIVKLPYSSYVRDEEDLAEMVQSMASFPRRRFDYVIGNPPYVSYNQCSRQGVLAFQLIKDGIVRLSNLFGVNLHSAPGRRKKYPPKPNLYAFFIALGLALLKDGGRLCYIIPQTILTESDYDVLRYHLSKFTTIEKIITFRGKMFVGRGLRQDKPIMTSSLVLVVSKSPPPTAHEVEVMNHRTDGEDIGACLQRLLAGEDTDKRMVEQRVLLENVANWSPVVRLGSDFTDLYDDYKRRTDSIAVYYDHRLAEQYFNSRFYFDVGFILDNSLAKEATTGNDLELVDFRGFRGFSKYVPSLYYPNDPAKIELPKTSQGYVTLRQRYKIIWSKVYSRKFYFTDRQVIASMSNAQMICSDNKEELLYLFSLLNSPVNRCVYEKLFQLENEQYGTFLVIKRIKEFIRVPRISETNRVIKDEVIKCAGELVGLEGKTLSDLVDFSGLFLQRFAGAEVDDDNLVLVHDDGQRTKLGIRQHSKLVAESLAEQLGRVERLVSLHELRNLPVIDYHEQRKLKAYIDHLVYGLYFGITLQRLGLSHAVAVSEMCRSDPYYEYVFEG